MYFLSSKASILIDTSTSNFSKELCKGNLKNDRKKEKEDFGLFIFDPQYNM
jgi:hypothetical protein